MFGRPVACPELRVTCLLEAWSRRDKQKFLRGHFLEALEHRAPFHKIQALSLSPLSHPRHPHSWYQWCNSMMPFLHNRFSVRALREPVVLCRFRRLPRKNNCINRKYSKSYNIGCMVARLFAFIMQYLITVLCWWWRIFSWGSFFKCLLISPVSLGIYRWLIKNRYDDTMVRAFTQAS